MDKSNDYEYFCHKYRISNKIKNRFKYIAKNYENVKRKNFFSEENIKKEIYLSSKNNVIDLLLFSTCINKGLKPFDIEKLIKYIKIYKVPKFPISGDYLKERGYESGQELGKKLKLLEEEWIKNNFVLDKKLLEKSLNKIN